MITDITDTSALYDAGITRPDDYIKTRYLDVYVKYNADETGFEVYGYVLTDSNITAIKGKEDQPLSWDTPAAKSSGYIADSETEKGTDEYHTIDIKVTKVVTGAMGDKTHEFPFAITVSNSNLYFYSGELASTPSAVSQLTSGNATSLSALLKNDEVFYIFGLNPKATVVYTETNNTPDTYQVTIKDNAGAIVNSVDAEDTAPLTGTQTTGTLAVSNYDTDNSDSSVKATIIATGNNAITFTNNLNEISPTGVALRVAPYALMLVGGIVLLLVSRRRKAAAEE